MLRSKRKLDKDSSSDEDDKAPAKRVRKVNTATRTTTKSAKVTRSKRKLDRDSSADENDEIDTKTVLKIKTGTKTAAKSSRSKATGQ